METKFRALYYPYSRCLYENNLKRAALVFDEILFVDPGQTSIIKLNVGGKMTKVFGNMSKVINMMVLDGTILRILMTY
jgi:hypothetical protein